MSELVIEFAGERITVADRLTFGRTADLEIDENRFLHRQVGEFLREDGQWWLRNTGSHIHLTVVTDDGKRVELPPKAVQALASSQGVVRFSAGPARYEIEFEIPSLAQLPALDTELSGDVTTQFGLILTPREIDFVVTFARARLLGLDEPLPTYAEVARLWGVSPKTLDNTIQGVKRKLRDSGIARDEPLETLVGLMVRHGLITRVDLEWAGLEGPDQPRSAIDGPRFGDA